MFRISSSRIKNILIQVAKTIGLTACGILVIYILLMLEGSDKTVSSPEIRPISVGYDHYGYACLRGEPYPMPPEFKRALSLIEQRFAQQFHRLQGQGKKAAADYVGLYVLALTNQNGLNLQNCLDIQYAQSEDQMSGAEGYFVYDTTDRGHLKIKVSPRYSARDDLLTAFLLSHEIDHAIESVTFQNDKPLEPSPVISAARQCYLIEANAFTRQVTFFTALNEEEQRSIVTRVGSDEAREAYETVIRIIEAPGEDIAHKALTDVQSNPAYHAQCDKRK